MTEKFDLPVKYSKTTPKKRRLIREQYIKEQNGLCYWCECPLCDQPPQNIMEKEIELKFFPPGFLNAPIHLQHCHTTDWTEGAVHARCNAVMWQYHMR